jgi:hypothetical protein
MAKKSNNVIVDKTSTYGKKPPVVITSQGTPEHKRDPIYTMSAHDKAELFIKKMREQKPIIKTKKKKKGRN